jgi:glycosyltransferase involved in cell wall biosynthesis
MRILYLFVVDWSKEVADYDRGAVPSHRLFGFVELKKMGHEPSIVQRPGWLRNLLSKPIYWRIYQALAAVWRQRKVDAIFAVNEAAALPPLILKRLGLLKTPVIVFNTALMHPRNFVGLRKKMWDWALPAAEIMVSQTKMELGNVWKAFGLEEGRQRLMHMLVDMEYFQPEPSVPLGDYCLAVGTNEAKDFPTLMKAFPKDEKLIIVTDPYNAAIVEKHREPDMPVQVLQAVPITKLKRMYQEAKLTINPLTDTPYGSGHTVVLENMVLGKPVIATRVGGMIDYFEEGVSALGYTAGDVEDLREKIRAYLADPGKFAHIGQQSPQWVRPFSAVEFARTLLRIAGELCQNPKAATTAATSEADRARA